MSLTNDVLIDTRCRQESLWYSASGGRKRSMSRPTEWSVFWNCNRLSGFGQHVQYSHADYPGTCRSRWGGKSRQRTMWHRRRTVQ